jgi:AcrR family transcriptional regulator
MAQELSGGGDPARTLAILWGVQDRRKRGPRPTLTVARIVEAAIAVAEADGDLEGLTKLLVADHLGVGTKSLYTYFPSKAELVDAMLDTAYASLPDLEQEPDPRARAGRPETTPEWRARLRRAADARWALYQRHPWLLQVFTGRPTLGPHAVRAYERELGAVEGIGLDDVEMDAVITLVHTHVEGVARRKHQTRLAERSSGMTDEQWWRAAEPVFATVFDPGVFPLAARVGTAAGEAHGAAHDPDHEYAFGLELLLDGVTSRVSDAAAPGRPRRTRR